MGDLSPERVLVTVEALEKAEAERDEWRRAADANMALAERNADTIDRLCDERDEARAERARLQDLHTRCAAFDDQPGPSCVTLAAKCAALREALEGLERLGSVFWSHIHDGVADKALEQARAALATDAGEET